MRVEEGWFLCPVPDRPSEDVLCLPLVVSAAAVITEHRPNCTAWWATQPWPLQLQL